ncbi:MAG: helix-turn-helix domain-containing protein [Chloroflexota bacterium]
MASEARQRILAAASNLLERQGYHATGLNQIVDESDTPRGSLYYYFPEGKEELAAEAVTLRMSEAIAHTIQFLKQVDDPAEAIFSMINMASQKIVEQGYCTGAPIAAVALETSNSNERIRQACAHGYQGLQDVIVAKLVLSGFSAQKASALAATIVASMEGAMILSRTQQNGKILAQVADQMKILIQTASKV